MLKRINRVAYRASAITPDVAEALRELELRAAQVGNLQVQYDGPKRDWGWKDIERKPGPTGCRSHLSMVLTGREVSLRLRIKDWQGNRADHNQAALEALWGLVVPLGFMPWNRYPLVGNGDDVYHFFGPWRGLYDHLCSEGRGEAAWPSLACAAQVDVGTWEGDRSVERFVQAQLHRLGAHCGIVDGIIGERTQAAIQYLGVGGAPLKELAEHLRDRAFESKDEETERQYGYVVIPGRKVVASAYGDIHTTRIPQGVALTVDGPGRVVLDVGNPEGGT